MLFVEMASVDIRIMPNMLEFYIRYSAAVPQFQRTDLGYQDWLAVSRIADFMENLGKHLQESLKQEIAVPEIKMKKKKKTKSNLNEAFKSRTLTKKSNFCRTS